MDLKALSPLLDILGVGTENARSSKELGNILGWKEAAVGTEINRLRKLGVPICVSVHGFKGYFLPSCRNESKSYERQFRNRLIDAQAAWEVFSQYMNDVSPNEPEKEKK